MNGGLNVKLVSEEQKQIGVLRQENESLKEKEKSEENARLKSEKEGLERQLVEKTEQVNELKRENEGLKEKSQPELFKELQDKFYDKPGLMDAKQLQKISIQAGRDLETWVRRYSTIINNAVQLGEPVPMGLYIITKPDMKLVPVRVLVDFDKRRIDVSLWEKKLAG
jgi:regulator of replication initiation timing